MSRDVLVLDDVTVRYPDAPADALSSCSLRVPAGAKVALLGLNGSGKTTLLGACAGLVSHRGTIRLDDIEVKRRNLSAVRRRIGYLFAVPDDQLLVPRVLDDVAIALRREDMDPDARRRRATETLHRLGIGDLADRSPHDLSHGQKQLVALAGALVADPPLLLLDEPSASLDPPSRVRLARILASLPSAIVLATHDLAFARRCCDEYLLLSAGRLVDRGADFDAVLRSWEDLP